MTEDEIDSDVDLEEEGITVIIGIYDKNGCGAQVTVSEPADNDATIATALVRAMKGVAQVRGNDTVWEIHKACEQYVTGKI